MSERLPIHDINSLIPGHRNSQGVEPETLSQPITRTAPNALGIDAAIATPPTFTAEQHGNQAPSETDITAATLALAHAPGSYSSHGDFDRRIRQWELPRISRTSNPTQPLTTRDLIAGK